MKEIKKIICVTIIIQMLTVSVGYTEEKKIDLSLQDITLPSEVKDLSKQSGAIFYNSSTKNKALIPTHFWGEIQKPGLHFIPTDTSLIKGLSMAGGPTSSAFLEKIKLTRVSSDGKLNDFHFNLEEGGGKESFDFKIEPGDTIFIQKDSFSENRAYYTGLISIALSIITTFFIVNRIE